MSVESTGSALTVRVTGVTDLRVVLETLCQRLEATCKLPASVAHARVEPRTIQGTWTEVVAELVGGSEFSFGATPPAEGRVAYLFVEPRAKAKPADVGNGRAAVAAAPTEDQPKAAEEPSALEPAPASEEESPSEPAVEAPVDATAEGALVTAATAAATPGAAFAMTPFADASGNPLMSRITTPPGAPAPSMATLPYSDEAGNPLVVPITNEPLSLTPFAGPDGEAWPAPVPIPGQKLEYPIPPTVPPATKPENQ